MTAVLVEDTAKLRDLVAWLRRQGKKTQVGKWRIDADIMCLADDDSDRYKGDIAGLITTELLGKMTADALYETGYPLPHTRTAICGEYGVRGEFYESFVNVDEILEDFPALHDQLTCEDYARTLENYLDRGVVGEVSWRWYLDELHAAAVS